MFVRSLSMIALASLFLVAISCKTVARAAARYWTNKQIKEFITNCEEKSSKLIGDEKAKRFCNCAVDAVAEEYQNYQDTKTVSAVRLLEVADNCR